MAGGVEAHLRQQEIETVEAIRLKREQTEAERKAKAADFYLRLDRLVNNEDVTWFFDAFVKPIAAAEHAAALDVKNKTPEQRNEHAHRFEVADTICNLLAERHRFSKNQAGVFPQK